MTIKECIDKVDNLKPNQYSLEDKVDWLSFVEMTIINDVLKAHEGYDGRYDNFKGYSADRTDVELIVPSPYDRLYTAFLTMKIDESNGETTRYNNSAILYNSYMAEFRKHYNKTHMPIDVTKKAPANVVNNSINLTDAMYANLVKDLTHILTQYFSGAVSPDKIYDIVMSYMQNNAELFKGKDGKTPIKGQDYFTEDEVNTIVTSTTNNATENIRYDVGDKKRLDTLVKDTLVNAINEVNQLSKQNATNIEKIKNNSSGSGESLSYFKVLPEDADIDALDEEGKYIVDKRINVTDYIETITVRSGTKKYEDFDTEYQTIYQVKECFGSNGYEMLIRNKVSDFEWSDWQDVFGGGGEFKYFPYEPQIDITLEEAVQKLEVNEINGISWADSDFTAIKVMVENAVLETAGPNTQVCVYINSRGYTSTQTVLGSPTTFINATKKQYWSCYADLKSGLMITCDTSTTNETWASGISMPINMQRLNLKEKLEFISIDYMNPNEAFPVGTRFRIWLR